MTITHHEARQLIQFKADRPLSTHDRSLLDAHLELCQECNIYSSQIKSMEVDLRTALKRQWDAKPLPFHVTDLYKRKGGPSSNTSVPTRKLLVGITTLLFAFTIWQFALTGTTAGSLLVVDASPNPLPAQSTGTTTQNGQLTCDQLAYRVQAGDTLANLAERFSTSAEAISNLNSLETQQIKPASEILIPLCTLTPTSTQHLPSPTLTPSLQTATTTPG